MENYYKAYAQRKRIGDYAFKFANYIYKNYFKKVGRVLDIGCGAGYYMSAFKRLGYEPFGIDNDSEALKISSKFGKVNNLDLSKTIKLPFEDNYFDFVFAKSVIEHSHNPAGLIKEIKRVSKDKSIIFILVPAFDRKSVQAGFHSDPTHISEITTNDLKNMTKSFEVIKLKKFVNFPYLWRFTDLAFRVNWFNKDDNFMILRNHK